MWNKTEQSIINTCTYYYYSLASFLISCNLILCASFQQSCYEEQLARFGEELQPVEYDTLKDCAYLERCLKETLRLRPPIMTMMRMCKTQQVFHCTLCNKYTGTLLQRAPIQG